MLLNRMILMQKENTVITAAVAALVIGALAGYWWGASSSKQKLAEADKKTQELQTALNVFVPPLPDTVNVIGGKITAINENAFILEIPSLTDRYPKPGMPMKTETKTVSIAAGARITSTNFDSRTFKNGVPQKKTISASDLKTGDIVSVTVKENARTEQNLTAVSISRSSGI